MTAEDWDESGFDPGNGKTPCRQGCTCKKVVTNEPLTKNLPAVLRSALAGKSVDIHDHIHSEV